MQLNEKEEHLIRDCRKQKASWGGWPWSFWVTGSVVFGGGGVILCLSTLVSNPKEVPKEVGPGALMWCALGLYLLDSVFREWRRYRPRPHHIKAPGPTSFGTSF